MRAEIGVVKFVREALVVHCGGVGVEGVGSVNKLESFGNVGRHWITDTSQRPRCKLSVKWERSGLSFGILFTWSSDLSTLNRHFPCTLSWMWNFVLRPHLDVNSQAVKGDGVEVDIKFSNSMLLPLSLHTRLLSSPDIADLPVAGSSAHQMKM